MHVLPSMFVSSIKSSGLKFCVVALGCNQVQGIDYDATFAPEVKLSSVGVFLATVALQNLAHHQMDVVKAFLHCDLYKDIYIHHSPVCSTFTILIWCKTLHGLKQAPRMWH